MSPQRPTIRIRPADICACFGRHLVAAFIVSTLRSWGKSVRDGIWPGEEGGDWWGEERRWGKGQGRGAEAHPWTLREAPGECNGLRRWRGWVPIVGLGFSQYSGSRSRGGERPGRAPGRAPQA